MTSEAGAALVWYHNVLHANYVADTHADPDSADSPVVASEFCGTSITSQGPDARLVAGIRDSNPHIRHADGSKRGYVLLDIDRDRLLAKLRVLDTVRRPDAEVSTDATFTVRAGRPGVAATAWKEPMKWLLAFAAVTLAAVVPNAGHAQGFPQKRPVTLVVPFAAGGGTDALARELSTRGSSSDGKRENRGYAPKASARELPQVGEARE